MARGLTENRTRNTLLVVVVFGLCSFFYLLGLWRRSGSGGGDRIQTWVNEQTKCVQLSNLNFETHHSASDLPNGTSSSETKAFQPCDEQYTDYTPCEEQKRAMTFPRDNMIYRERHCPPEKEKLHCLIPAPKGYVAPFPWPKSRDFVSYANVPHKSLTVEKAIQNWVHYEGNVFRYKKMTVCITPLPEVNSVSEVAGGQLEPFPKRLNAVPPRIALGSVPGFSVQSYEEDNKLWQKHVMAYKKTNNLLGTGRYRNIMDMNAGLGSFAAALESPKLWVMNIVPTIADTSTLGVIYERGLIGMYHDWCEGFSTYPRTYDLIHANAIFALYENKCKFEDILLEMDRILRPEGAVIIHDKVGFLVKVEKIAKAMSWDTRLADHEGGPHVPEKILFVVKKYWTITDKSN
ncbi:hypothetical protein PR202_gb20044 [Eleusine coracana subsp. coracana]|uniref:Methyltransferase n=1 Tax=Eleusine coracana subsp. coracana TaxID=191504 RepID=A0AAV5FAE9_ELECO|nr:hypothetical protein PR202_gb20044 [Eleusine coracana subsp. coracana]